MSNDRDAYSMPIQKAIIPPEGGWKPHSYYWIEISWDASNPIYVAIFYTGFLNGKREGEPGAYNAIWKNGHNIEGTFNNVYFLKVLEEIKEPSNA